MESLLPEYSAFGEVRQAAGSALPGIAPTNAYQCADGGYVLVAGNGDSIFKRLMTVIGRDDLGNDPQLENNDGRVKRVAELDQAIGEWTKTVSTTKALEVLDSVAVPAARAVATSGKPMPAAIASGPTNPYPAVAPPIPPIAPPIKAPLSTLRPVKPLYRPPAKAPAQ